MATMIESGTFTYSKEELKDWSAVIHERTFNDQELNALHDIETGIIYDEQVVFSGPMGLMGKKVTGCVPSEITGVTLTEKVWKPVKEDFRLKHCSVDVNAQNKLINQYAKVNPDFKNVIEGSNSAVGSFLVMKVEEGFKTSLLRKAWFSDIATDNIVSGGQLKNGEDKLFWNSFDGFFKQIFTEIPNTAKNYTAIAKNTGASYALQALAAGDGKAILKSVYQKADSRLRDAAGVTIKVTTSVYDAYLNDLEDSQTNGAGNTMIMENGQVILKYRSITLEKMDIWDRTIESYFNNGTKLNLPHRAVMSVASNLKIGTTAVDDFGSIDAFYDKVTGQNYIDGIYTIAALHLEKYMTSVAY